MYLRRTSRLDVSVYVDRRQFRLGRRVRAQVRRLCNTARGYLWQLHCCGRSLDRIGGLASRLRCGRIRAASGSGT